MAKVSIERFSPFLFVYKKKKIYTNTKYLTLNHHLGLINESAKHCLYRVHGIKIGKKEKIY